MKDKKWKIAVVLLTVLMAAAVSVWDVIEIVQLFRAGGNNTCSLAERGAHRADRHGDTADKECGR